MKKIIAFLIITILIITGCSTLRDIANIQQPTVDFNRVSVQSFTFNGVNLLFDFEVNNPNQVGVDAEEYNYEFFINDNSFVSGRQEENLRIDRRSSSFVQIPVSLNFSEIYNTFGSLAGRDSLSYRIASEIQFDIPGLGTRMVPFSAAGGLPIPKVPNIEFGGIEVKNLSFSGADLELGIRIFNPNSFGLNLSKLDYLLNVNGRQWLNASMLESFRIGAKEENILRIPIRLNAAEMGSVLREMMGGSSELQYDLSGAADITAEIDEFDVSGTLPFELSGTYITN
tara:strand:+ start:14003 stop:14854 length:852 start_codon:yes stop_codon:yes gene_type:complete